MIDVTIADAVRRYHDYRKSEGVSRSSRSNAKQATDQLLRWPGMSSSSLAALDPMTLYQIMRSMAAAGLARTTVNDRRKWILHFVAWAEHPVIGLAAPGQHAQLSIVGVLRPGRSPARETPRIPPADESLIRAVLASAPLRLATMMRVQMLASMRPMEVCAMRWSWIRRDAKSPDGSSVWAVPMGGEAGVEGNKMAYRGRLRIVYLGPECQRLLTRWRADQLRRAGRKFAAIPDAVFPGRNGAPMTQPAYRRMVTRRCDQLGLARLHVRQLRKNGLQRVADRFGLDAARDVAGHDSSETTRVYAVPTYNPSAAASAAALA